MFKVNRVNNEITYSFYPQKAWKRELFFFVFFGTKANMTHASINTLKLPPLASSFLDYGTLWGCLEVRIPAVCESGRNFWPINCFDLEFCLFLWSGDCLPERPQIMLIISYNSSGYTTFKIGYGGRNLEKTRGQPE